MYVLATYLALVLLATPLHATIPIFLLYCMLGVGVFVTLGADTQKIESGKPTFFVFLIPLTILATTRLIPFMRYGWSALGADIGAYYGAWNTCFASLASCAGNPLALTGLPLYAVGIGTQTILIAFHLLATAVIGRGIYVLAKDRFGARAAFSSLMAYALSLPQFLFYWSFFLKMEMGMAFSLFALHAYSSTRTRGFIYAALAGIIHPLTAVPLALTFIAAGITDNKKAYAFKAAVISVLAMTAFHAKEIIGYATYATDYAQGTYAPAASGLLAGHFVGFSFYHDALMLFYVPFALLGIAWCVGKKSMPAVGWYALVNLALVSVNAVFHNRFIVLFDISCIVLAGYALSLFEYRQKTVLKKIALFFILAALAGYSLYQAARMEPLVNRVEFAELTALQGKYGGMPIFINNAIYRGFVGGYTGHPVIFASFNEEPWKSFAIPSLIYNARRSTPIHPENDPYFTRVSERVLKYAPAGLAL